MGSIRVLLFLAVIIAVHSQTTEALRILGIFPLPGRSHFIPASALMKGLAERGHQVDVVTHFPLKKPIPNYKDFPLTAEFSAVNNLTFEAIKQFDKLSMKHFIDMTGIQPCNLLSSDTLQKILKTPKNTYDVIIVEVILIVLLNISFVLSISPQIPCGESDFIYLIYVKTGYAC